MPLYRVKYDEPKDAKAREQIEDALRQKKAVEVAKDCWLLALEEDEYVQCLHEIRELLPQDQIKLLEIPRSDIPTNAYLPIEEYEALKLRARN